jgi:hypothetical protein
MRVLNISVNNDVDVNNNNNSAQFFVYLRAYTTAQR